ncbi:MAG: condensation domain-containing protein, partial [Candidatus Competibacterales bacterium]
PQVAGGPSVALLPPYSPLQVVSLDALQGAGPPLQQWLCRQASAPFDLERGPLLRATLGVLADSEHLLVVTLHHIITDGWSMALLLRELSQLYGACRAQRPSDLPPLPIAYSDYAAWQHHWLQGERLETQLRHWCQRLEGAPERLVLPTDYTRPAVMTGRGAYLERQLDEALIDELQALASAHGATLYMILLAAFQLLLAHYSGQDDILVANSVATRPLRETEGLVGCFVNRLVMRTRLANDRGDSFIELLEQVRHTTLEALAHPDLPISSIQKRLNLPANPSHNPFAQTRLVLHNAPPGHLGLPGVAASRESIPYRIAKDDLALIAVEERVANPGDGGRGLRCRWDYACDLFAPRRVASMAEHYGQLLNAVVAHPHQSIWQLARRSVP